MTDDCPGCRFRRQDKLRAAGRSGSTKEPLHPDLHQGSDLDQENTSLLMRSRLKSGQRNADISSIQIPGVRPRRDAESYLDLKYYGRWAMAGPWL